MISSLSHAGLAGYLLRSRIDAGPPRADGAVALVFDGNIRVLLKPGRRGELVPETQLALLASRPQADEEAMFAALTAAAARPLTEGARLALDEAGGRFVLQASIPSDASSSEFESALATFLSAVNAWRAHFGTL